MPKSSGNELDCEKFPPLFCPPLQKNGDLIVAKWPEKSFFLAELGEFSNENWCDDMCARGGVCGGRFLDPFRELFALISLQSSSPLASRFSAASEDVETVKRRGTTSKA